MSHPILAARRSAASSCNRIELFPSRLGAAAWLAWLTLACLVTWFAVALPWPARIAICGALATTGIRGVREFVLLAGPRAVRAIEWTEAGEFFVCLGPGFARHPATLSNGTFRLGVRYWVVCFATPTGPRAALVEASGDPHPFRRLSRRLTRHLQRGSGRSPRPAVTIRPKV